MLAAIRPDDWNFALLLHITGAVLLVGALVTAAAYLVCAWRSKRAGDELPHSRVAFKTLLILGIPAWFLMRIAAQWLADKEGFKGGDDEPAWLGIGYITSELGGLLLLVATILAGLGVRQLRKGAERSVLLRISTVLVLLLIVVYAITVWAMGAKPD
jgi:uncharacterized membrane protein